jgi:hypothetical protein
VRDRRIERIELEAPGHRDARRVGAELHDPPRRFFALHAEPVDVGEDAPEERADETVSRIGARGDAPVDHDRPDPLRAAFAQEIRPDLGFHHDEHPRLHDAERAADDERPVERKIKDIVDVFQVAPRDLLAGHRRRREIQPQARVPFLQVGHQRTSRERLAHRYGVNPDGFLALVVERDGQVPQPLPEAADVFLVADRLIQEVGRHHDEQQQGQEAVEEVHRK